MSTSEGTGVRRGQSWAGCADPKEGSLTIGPQNPPTSKPGDRRNSLGASPAISVPITKCHRLRGLKCGNIFSRFWSLEVPGQGVDHFGS